MQSLRAASAKLGLIGMLNKPGLASFPQDIGETSYFRVRPESGVTSEMAGFPSSILFTLQRGHPAFLSSREPIAVSS